MASHESCIYLLMVSLFLFSQSFVSADMSLIRAICKTTPYSNVCFLVLSSDPRSITASNKTSLARIAMQITAAKCHDISLYASQLLRNATDPGYKQDLEDCRDSYDQVEFGITQDGLPKFDQGRYGDAGRDTQDAAIASETCDEHGIKALEQMNTLISDFSIDAKTIVNSLSKS
ncbi:cell wall / vacuolar inhibitor of fructosidase 2-like [Cornus florida]|uniref:cell wall / vacuolar inhibitor of fructosidase 2-like n=1 Tax=Cornus florida TaxID=4283 RepID=UPI0028A05178|nr:cell wall / vacuolar inhibitor of fructosidase 2-like [Cornus florida]